MTTMLSDSAARALTDMVLRCTEAGVDMEGPAHIALQGLRNGSLTTAKARGLIESLRTRLYEAKDLPRCP